MVSTADCDSVSSDSSSGHGISLLRLVGYGTCLTSRQNLGPNPRGETICLSGAMVAQRTLNPWVEGSSPS